ncbi:AI-2E family transporter [Leekyejoonella antrihumi]|uniref:AI-2E family transporter n=2 Tax=Leekyejoonella antrihumi TaxID=1660198 RepID=A0A563E8X4_9MICO|nr:AI-2E family transporter [Leekyejoonella antrihumi]
MDRSKVISHGLRWTASWSLRTIVILAALWGVLQVLTFFWSALLPVALALVVSTVLWPLARWLRSKGFPPALAAVASMVGVFLVIGGLIAAIAPSVSSQWSNLTDKAISGVDQVQTWLQGPPFHVSHHQINSFGQTITDKIQQSGNQIASGVFSGVSVAGHVLIDLIVTLVLTFFFIKDGPRFLPWLRLITGRHAGAHLTEALSRAYATLGGFIRTQAIVSAVDSTCIFIGLVVLGVPLAAPLAIITFFGGFIPIVGAFVAGVLAVLVALVTKSVTTAIIVLIIIVLVQQLEGHILSPLLQSRSMSLHPALVLLSIALGGDEFGIMGAFFAVPVVAIVAVLLRYLGEQIDLRTGDLQLVEVESMTPEGQYAAASSVRRGLEMRAHDRSD